MHDEQIFCCVRPNFHLDFGPQIIRMDFLGKAQITFHRQASVFRLNKRSLVKHSDWFSMFLNSILRNEIFSLFVTKISKINVAKFLMTSKSLSSQKFIFDFYEQCCEKNDTLEFFVNSQYNFLLENNWKKGSFSESHLVWSYKVLKIIELAYSDHNLWFDVLEIQIL